MAISEIKLNVSITRRSLFAAGAATAGAALVGATPEIVITNPPPEPSLIRRIAAELAERKGPPDEPA